MFGYQQVRSTVTPGRSDGMTGYHVRKDLWDATIGEELPCQSEHGNTQDAFAVAVLKTLTALSLVTSHERFPLCAECSVCIEGSSIQFQIASPSAIRRISWPWTSYPTSLLYPFSVLAHVSFASESVDNLGLVIVGGNNYRLQMPGWLRKNTIWATYREPRPSWALVEAECSNQMQVAQGQQGLVRDCALVQAAMVALCVWLVTVLPPPPATCTGGDFPQPRTTALG